MIPAAKWLILAAMTALRKLTLITEQEYLGLPCEVGRSREFVDGHIFPISEPTDAHEIIALNIASSLKEHLSKHRCRVFKGNKRVRVEFLNRVMPYYPDVMVVCEPPSGEERFKENPVLAVEVPSPSTEGTDIREKMFAYLNTQSVLHYVIVAQEKMEIIVYRRTQPPEGWEIETLDKPADLLRLADLGFEMSVADVYENAVPPPPKADL